MFNLFFKLGIEHILNINAWDHLLFIITLVGVYSLKEYKKILILITAFTLGHTLSLTLATFDLITLNQNLVEILIAFTILTSSIWNLFLKLDDELVKTHKLKYLTSVLFGLIHGLGFFSTIKDILLVEKKKILINLLAFNLGVEFGQIIVILIFSLISLFFIKIIKLKLKTLRLSIILPSIILALYLIFERL